MRVAAIFTFLLTALQVIAQKQGLEAIDSLKTGLIVQGVMDTNQVKTIYRIAHAYKNIDTDSAMHYSTWGLEMAEKNNWPKGVAAFFDNLGSLYSNNGNYLEAIRYYEASLKINRQIGNRKNETGNIINIGSVYQRQGDDAKALAKSFEALKISESINDSSYMALLYGNIADVYLSQENYGMALRYCLKAYELFKQLHDPAGLAGAADRVGAVYLAEKKLREADRYFQESLANYKEVDDKSGQAKAISHIALLHEDNPTRKLKYLVQAQQLFDETNPLHTLSITNMGNLGSAYGMIFYKTKDQKMAGKAELYLTKAVNAAEQVGDRDNLGYFCGELAALQESTGQYKVALSNYRKSTQITDTLYSQENKNKIAALEAQYAFREKEEAYKHQQQLSQLRIRQVYLYGAIIIIGVSAVLFFLLARSRIRRLQLKNELQKKEAAEKNRELEIRHKLSESELKAIRTQMNPHFIFNVLNSIESYIVENDARTASRLVQKFASLSRLILENSTQSLVPADKEWKALQLYAELEVMRFNKQFHCSFQVDPSVDLSRLLLPPMLVQPLIENSILHGMRNSSGINNSVIVSLEQTNTTLLFTVSDNGIGIDEAQKIKTFSNIKNQSIGLSSIKERIGIFNTIYEGQAACFEIRNKSPEEGKGTIASLILPKIFREN